MKLHTTYLEGAVLPTVVAAALVMLTATLGLLALWAALGALCWFFPPALIIAPGAGTLISTFLLDPAFRHYMPERSEFDEGTDTWYLE